MNFVPQTNRFGLWGSTMILFELAFFFLWLCDSGFLQLPNSMLVSGLSIIHFFGM